MTRGSPIFFATPSLVAVAASYLELSSTRRNPTSSTHAPTSAALTDGTRRKRWIPLLDWVGFDDWTLPGVESIASDPVDPDRVYLAVGTYTNEFTTQNGAILRSADRGRTWQRSNLPFKVGGNMPARSMGERLAIDPNKHNILYLGTRSGNGLWRSTDHGATWSKVAGFPNPGNYVQDPSNSYTGDIVGVVWVTFDPTTGKSGSATQTI